MAYLNVTWSFEQIIICELVIGNIILLKPNEHYQEGSICRVVGTTCFLDVVGGGNLGGGVQTGYKKQEGLSMLSDNEIQYS